MPTAGLEKPGTIGRLMAERTAQSWTTAPHFFVTREIDAGALIAAREKIASASLPGSGQTVAAKPTHTDLLVALVARVLTAHPRMNASWTTEGIRLHGEVNLAVAMAVDDGVVAPVIHKANAASLAEIAAKRRLLTERARTGKLQPAISPALPSQSATSACMASMHSPRLSFRRKLPSSPWPASPIELFQSMAGPVLDRS
jgi:pyruvate dehydrogenase E2 component (dihydrolipoamide acetyltransferase)